jgi:hypothetical protein
VVYPRAHKTTRLVLSLYWAQGAYYLITGIWPLVSVDSFQLVTGRKTDHLVTGQEADHWMLNTISALIIAIALVFIVAAFRKQASVEVACLGALSALALASIDVIYVARGTIWPIYLADAAAEMFLVLLWLGILVRWHIAAEIEQT